MEPAGKTVQEMTLTELSDMITLVADALDVNAESALVRGQVQTSLNFRSIAGTLRGSHNHDGAVNLKKMELLLEQGITLMHLARDPEPQHLLH